MPDSTQQQPQAQAQAQAPDFHVGQVLWFVPTGKPQRACEVKIEKVGRKWITLSSGHQVSADAQMEFKAASLGWTAPGRLYPSRGHYERHVERVSAWNALAADMQLSRSAGPGPDVTLDAIARARGLLGMAPLEVEEESEGGDAQQSSMRPRGG